MTGQPAQSFNKVTRHFFFWGALLCGLVLLWPTSGQTGPPTPQEMVTKIEALHKEYAAAVNRVDDPEELTALALTHAGRVWAVPARALAVLNQKSNVIMLLDRLEKESREEERTGVKPPERQVSGWHLLYEAVSAVARWGTFGRQDKMADKEARVIEDHVERSFDPGRGQGHAAVTLSNGVLSMLALAIKSADEKNLYASWAEHTMTATVNGAKIIGVRKDLHSRARYFLLLLNNARGCFDLIYYYGLTLEAGLGPDLEVIRRAWQKNTADDLPPTVTLTVTMTALSEASFRVAVHLAETIPESTPYHHSIRENPSW